MVNKFWKRLLNATVYMGFRKYFTIAKYENDNVVVCETINVFNDAFCDSKIHFHQIRPFNNVKIFTCFAKVYLQYEIVIQRVVTRKGLPSVQ